MKKAFLKVKTDILYLILLLLLSTIFSFLEYIGVPFKIASFSLIIINLIIIFIYSFTKSKSSSNKAIINGIKTSSRILLILFLLNIVTFTKISFKTFIYYIIVVLVAIMGAIFANYKKNSS